MTTDKLLTVCGLSLEVAGSGHQVVKSVSFDLAPGEIFGIVGESGSGKTLATRSLISLLLLHPDSGQGPEQSGRAPRHGDGARSG